MGLQDNVLKLKGIGAKRAQLLEKLAYAPRISKLKVIIILNVERLNKEAANSLLSALKQPEVSKMQISATVDVKGSAIESLAQATQALVAQQQEAIRAGRMSAKGIAESRIVEAEYVEA